MKHETNIDGHTLEELAIKISNLRYDKVAAFMLMLSEQFLNQAVADSMRGREKLAAALSKASTDTFFAADCIKAAWKICKPFMADSDAR